MSKVSQGVQHNNPFPPFPRRSAAEDLPLLCAKAPPPEGHQMTGPTMGCSRSGCSMADCKSSHVDFRMVGDPSAVGG